MRSLPIVVAMIAIAVPCAAVDIATKVGTHGTYNYVVSSDGLLYRTLHGDGASARFDIAIIGDGYRKTDADQRRFTAAVEQFVEGLFAVSPFSEAGEYINISLVNLISNDSGIDDPDPPTTTPPTPPLVRDTALDCAFVTDSMEIKGDPKKIEEVCTLAGVAFDVIYVVVNDSLGHDGSWWEPSPPVAISSDLFTWGTVMAHELGHAIATLADEYRAPDCGACLCPADCASHIEYRTYRDTWAPEEPNVTDASDSMMVPWKDLMTTGAFPTTTDRVSDGETIGRWEGAAAECYGIYRPREYCLMDGVMGDDPLVDDFCPVCSRAILSTLSTLYSYTP